MINHGFAAKCWEWNPKTTCHSLQFTPTIEHVEGETIQHLTVSSPHSPSTSHMVMTHNEIRLAGTRNWPAIWKSSCNQLGTIVRLTVVVRSKVRLTYRFLPHVQWELSMHSENYGVHVFHARRLWWIWS
jgi:hypothetical protein